MTLSPVAPVPEPPSLPGVSRSRLLVRGVDFHVTEAGKPNGLPVLLLHGWPQHHYVWRDLLLQPPPGLRLIAPDLPGYGWSGPPPHRWLKREVAADLLALIDALNLERALLVGHDWGGFLGHLMVLEAPERFQAFLALNILHPWNSPRSLAPQAWRLAYQPVFALSGMYLLRHTDVVRRLIRASLVDQAAVTDTDIAWFSERFRSPVCARAGTDTYRTFWRYELPHSARNPERRRSVVPTVALFGTADRAIHPSWADAGTARADDYRCQLVHGCGHFIVDERPQLVRRALEELAAGGLQP